MATGALSPDAMAEVVEGIADGCRQSGCALLGGETAEMPGFYPQGRYDLAGFCVAVVEESDLIDGHRIRPGDRVIGIASSGVHSNGFSLVRRVLTAAGADAETRYGPEERLLIDDLLQPTRLYPTVVQALLKGGVDIHGMAHITGGGLLKPAALFPSNAAVSIDPARWPRPPSSTGCRTRVRFRNVTCGTRSISAWAFVSSSPTRSSAPPCISSRRLVTHPGWSETSNSVTTPTALPSRGFRRDCIGFQQPDHL